MSKIDRQTLAKILPDPKSIKAFEDLFDSNGSNTDDVAKALKNADSAQISANAAQVSADNAQSSADAANNDLDLIHGVNGSTKVGFNPAGNISASTVQLALEEVDSEKLATTTLAASTGAALVGVAASGNISSPNLQLALQELDSLDGSGFRNVILNGSFIVNQRKYVSGTATTVANQYTLDRWRVVLSGQSVTFVATNNGNLVTVPAGGYEQVIEGSLIVDTTYVLNWLGNASGFVNGSPITKGAILSLTPGSNCTVKFSGGSLGSVQMEQGKTPHKFEPRPYSVELRLCQRYAFYWTSIGTVGVCATGAGGYAFRFPSTMRIVPTYTELTNGTFSDGVNSFTITSTSLYVAEQEGASVTFFASGTTGGRCAVLNSGGTAIFSAEF